MNLDESLKRVNSKETFLQFIKELKEDKIDEEEKEKIKPSSVYTSGANGWENGTVTTFLGAIEAYGKDSKLITKEPDWKNFALLLYAGKFYE